MIYRGVLPARGKWGDLDIEWDSETGEFFGAGATEAETLVDRALSDGYIELIPCLHHHFTGDPLTAEEIGSILNELWDVEGVFPVLDFDPDIPDGAVS